MVSDQKIVEDCIKGKRKAFNMLYKRYASTMLGICARYSHSLAEAEDILQEGFVKVFKNLKNFRWEGSFEGWIKRIMVNTAITMNRQNLKHSFHTNIDDVEELIGDEDENIAQVALTKDELLKLIQELPDGYRTVFNLYVFEGYTHKQIAELFDITTNTSKSQLSKARKQLKMKLDKISQMPKVKHHEQQQ